MAAKALGHPLPKGAQVHHVDGDKRNNAPGNLVICHDHGYHRLLHVRTNVVRAGGDPNTQRLCTRCHLPKLFTEFYKHHARALGISNVCQQCARAQRSKAGKQEHKRRMAERAQTEKATA